MAEAMLQQALADKTEISVSSAGLGSLAGHGASRHAVALMEERGIDISGHKARQLTPEMISDSDLILVMEKGHRRAIDSVEPAARGKIYRLCEWRDEDIPDPYGEPREKFVEVLELIERGVSDWASKLTA
jgi:protein-tyrosine phosphatase